MAIYNGNKLVKQLRIGDRPVRALRVGAEQVWPSVVRVDCSEDYGEWQYDDPIRRRTVTPWEQDVYCDDSVGERRYGTPYTQEKTAETVVDWDGSTYWNGSCGTDYYYVDYQKVRDKYTYSDGTVRYSDYRNGEIRSQRIDGQCGWVRDWRDTSDWYRTGGTCNAVGVNGAYDCDGTYSVNYWNEGKNQSYCYPDMSGSTQTRTIWRVGPVAERKQVDGQCGYTANYQRLGAEWWWIGIFGSYPDEGLYPTESSWYESDHTLVIDTGVCEDDDYLTAVELRFHRIYLNTYTGNTTSTIELAKNRISIREIDSNKDDNGIVEVFDGISLRFRKKRTNEPFSYNGIWEAYDTVSGAKMRIEIGLDF